MTNTREAWSTTGLSKKDATSVKTENFSYQAYMKGFLYDRWKCILNMKIQTKLETVKCNEMLRCIKFI